MIHGLRKYFLGEEGTPRLPKEFDSEYNGMDPLDILAFYIIDEDFLHPLLLQATAFEYQVKKLFNLIALNVLFIRVIGRVILDCHFIIRFSYTSYDSTNELGKVSW